MDQNDQLWDNKVSNVSSFLSQPKTPCKMDIEEKEILYNNEDTTEMESPPKKRKLR